MTVMKISPYRSLPARLATPAFVTLVLLVALLLGALAATAGAASPVTDWVHVKNVIEELNASPPAAPVVYLLGDSTARECTFSDDNWHQQVTDDYGVPVATYSLAGRNQTFAHDLKIVEQLPNVSGVALIGVGITRFTGAPTTKPPGGRPGGPPHDGWLQHIYDGKPKLTTAAKRAMVREWLATRYGAFKRHLKANRRDLELLIVECQKRGLTPVLVEMPLNTAVVRHAFDKPRSLYRARCRALAAKYRLSYLSFQAKVHLRNADFYDVWHLVKPGYVKWQAVLSAQTALLLPPLG